APSADPEWQKTLVPMTSGPYPRFAWQSSHQPDPADADALVPPDGSTLAPSQVISRHLIWVIRTEGGRWAGLIPRTPCRRRLGVRRRHRGRHQLQGVSQSFKIPDIGLAVQLLPHIIHIGAAGVVCWPAGGCPARGRLPVRRSV